MDMNTIARINWEWLETKEGMIFLKKLNKRIAYSEKHGNYRCSMIGCPFHYECTENCDKAFRTKLKSNCPCYNYKSPIDLAIILSDYYDMI